MTYAAPPAPRFILDLVEALQHADRFQVLVVLARQAVEGEGLLDGVLDPVGQLRVLLLPALQPAGQVAPRLDDIAAVIEPTQLLETIVVPLARHVIQRVA